MNNMGLISEVVKKIISTFSDIIIISIYKYFYTALKNFDAAEAI